MEEHKEEKKSNMESIATFEERRYDRNKGELHNIMDESLNGALVNVKGRNYAGAEDEKIDVWQVTMEVHKDDQEEELVEHQEQVHEEVE